MPPDPDLTRRLRALGLSAQRWLDLQAGARLLSAWLADQLTYGLASWEADPAGRLERIAAQLTDHHLGAPAAALRAWVPRVGQAHWAEGALHELGYWYLLCRLLARPEALTDEQFAGVALAVGHTLRKTALADLGQPVPGPWCCVGVEVTNQGALHARRVHWAPRDSTDWGAQLDFNYGGPLPPTQTTVGTVVDVPLLAYPGGMPGRVVLPEGGYTVSRAEAPPFAHASWEAHAAHNRRVVLRQPWRRELPVAVADLRCAVDAAGEAFVLVDAGGRAVSLPTASAGAALEAHWNLLALAGGEPVTVYGAWRDGALTPLSVWAEARLQGLGQ